jgi:hypothetical protein
MIYEPFKKDFKERSEQSLRGLRGYFRRNYNRTKGYWVSGAVLSLY